MAEIQLLTLTISGTDLTVNGVGDNVPFLLKTTVSTVHKILQVTPSGGKVDFKISSNNVSGGYVNQWTEKTETSSVSVNHIVGVSSPNTDYVAKVNGVAFGKFNSGPSSEINFNRTGNVVWEVYTIERFYLPPPTSIWPSFEIAFQRQPTIEYGIDKIVKKENSFIITIKATDVSGIYSVVAVIKDVNNNEVRKILSHIGDDVYSEIFTTDPAKYPYRVWVFAVDNLGYGADEEYWVDLGSVSY